MPHPISLLVSVGQLLTRIGALRTVCGLEANGFLPVRPAPLPLSADWRSSHVNQVTPNV